MTAGRTPAKPKSKPKKAGAQVTADREALFLQHYLADPDRNGTQAAIAAGYSPKSARYQARDILKRPHIAPHVGLADAKAAEVVSAVIERATLTKERAAEMLATMALGDVRDILTFGPEHRKLTLMDGSVVKTSGVGIIPSDEISTAAAMCIEEVSEGPNGIRVKMVSRRGALMDLAKLQGWIVDKTTTEVPALDRFTEMIRTLSRHSALPVGPRALPSPSTGNE